MEVCFIVAFPQVSLKVYKLQFVVIVMRVVTSINGLTLNFLRQRNLLQKKETENAGPLFPLNLRAFPPLCVCSLSFSLSLTTLPRNLARTSALGVFRCSTHCVTIDVLDCGLRREAPMDFNKRNETVPATPIHS